jgi:hypothetical protein
MALKVGDLYVSLTANTQKLQGQLNNASKKISAFGRSMKTLGKDAGDMSNMVMLAVGAAVAAASSKDAAVKKQVDELKNQSTALAIEVGRAALPMLSSMADAVGRVVALFRAMTPEQRSMVTNFIAGAAAVSGLALAAVKIAPAFALIASAIDAVAAGLEMLNVGLLPFIAGIASLIIIAGLLREAWDQNLGGIQEKAAAVWTWMQESGGKLGATLGEAAAWLGKKFQTAFIWIAETFAGMVKKLLEGMSWLAKKMGLDSFIDIDGMQEFGNTVADWIAQMPTDAGLESLKVDAINTMSMIKSGVSKIGDDITAKVKGIFGNLPKAAKATKFKDLTDKAQEDFGRLRADKMDASFRALRGRGGNLRDSMEMAGALNVPAELEKFNGEALSSIKGIEDVRDFLHKLGAKGGETEKYLSAWEKWNEDQRKAAQHVDRLRADRAPVAAQQFLGGGQTFGDAARMAGVTSGIPAALEGLSGATLTTVSAWEDLEDQLAQVRDLNPVVREFYDASRKTFEDALAKQKELEESRKTAISGLKDSILGSLGKVGGIIQAATGPLAQALGPIGALIGIIVELVSGSEGFKTLVSALDGIFQGLSDALGQLLMPVAMVVNALQPIVSAVGTLVAQVLPLVNAVLEPLLPIFVILGVLLMALSPIIDVLVNVLQIALIPVMGLLNFVMKALFGAIQVVAYIILAYAIMYGELWNGILYAVQSVLNFLSAIEIAGGKPFAFLADWATTLESSKVATDDYKKQMDGVAAMTWDSATTTAKSFNDAGAAADQLAAGMTNAASGFKVDLARFNASNVGAGPGSPADLGVGSSSLVGDTYVTIISNDPEAIWNKMESVRRRKSFQAGRGPLGGLPAFGS